ncbi:MAG: hypothetical protein IJN94_04405 [Clostridia bacterium]|nr:hypothetical protein [Clostridia bacterium]
MIRHIKIPNLPQKVVKHCLIGKKYTDEIKELNELGIECFTLKANPLLEDEINSHSDILAFNFGDGQILLNDDSIGEEELKSIGVTPVYYKNKICSPYPNDIALNVAFTGRHIICNSSYTATEIKEFTQKNNIEIINTKQGYSKCNLCIVNETAVITEDKGLARLLKKYQYDVLLISSGDIYLSDKHYGFIGGASCKIANDKMYFSGDLSSHRDYKSIVSFLDLYNIKPVYNKSRRLTDFGGIIQLTEKTY